MNRLVIIRNVLKAAYSLGWRQYREAMRDKLHYLPGFDQASDKYDIIALVKSFKAQPST